MKFLQVLLEAVLKPVLEWFKDWLKEKPWWVAFALLLLVGGVVVYVKYPDAVTDLTAASGRYARFAITLGKLASLPERETLAARAKTKQLIVALDSRLDKTHALAGQAWTTAQVLIALRGLGKLSPDVGDDVVARFFRSNAGPNCACWKKYPEAHLPSSIAVSSWVLWAMAVYAIPAAGEELDFLLKSQHLDGWWPMFAGAELEKFASSYATAVAAIALYEQAKLLQDSTKASRLSNAVERAATWLQGRVVSSKARWVDYPAWPIATVQQESLGISGFVHYALHHVGAHGLPELDRTWLANLPRDIPSALRFDASNKTVQIQPGNQSYTDESRYYGLPWSIAATARAYSNGSFVERIAAIEWVERALKPGSSFYSISGTREDDWIAAELLIALRHLPEMLPDK